MARTSRLVAVGMSGGVDSTVAALLLKRKGVIIEVIIGVHMHNWDELDESGQCTSESDYVAVQEICSHIQVPCRRVNFVKEYWNEVFSYFLDEIQKGRTPNPDIVCNQTVKFNSFYNYAISELGAWKIATGHYAQLASTSSREVQLLRAVDNNKDQTYFLSQVPQHVLRQVLFPIGQLLKSEVRQVAREAGLSWVAERKESMGLCFVGKRNFSNFISQYLEDREGVFLNLNGETIAKHKGHHYFTLGQRALIGGQRHPYFVCGKDPSANTVTVAEGSDHPALYTHSFTTLTPHWISHERSCDQAIHCQMRYRHQQPLRWSTVHRTKKGGLTVHCEEAMLAVTPGQYAVFYDGEQCLGGACIDIAEPSLWQREHNG